MLLTVEKLQSADSQGSVSESLCIIAVKKENYCLIQKEPHLSTLPLMCCIYLVRCIEQMHLQDVEDVKSWQLRAEGLTC